MPRYVGSAMLRYVVIGVTGGYSNFEGAGVYSLIIPLYLLGQLGEGIFLVSEICLKDWRGIG